MPRKNANYRPRGMKGVPLHKDPKCESAISTLIRGQGHHVVYLEEHESGNHKVTAPHLGDRIAYVKAIDWPNMEGF